MAKVEVILAPRGYESEVPVQITLDGEPFNLRDATVYWGLVKAGEGERAFDDRADFDALSWKAEMVDATKGMVRCYLKSLPEMDKGVYFLGLVVVKADGTRRAVPIMDKVFKVI